MLKTVSLTRIAAFVFAATAAYPQLQVESGALPIPQNLSGSVPTGEATQNTLTLTLLDAIQRGLKYNIGVVGGNEDIRTARADRMQALRNLLPNLTAKLNATGEQVDLAAFGFSGFPGIPNVIGPFSVYDARAYLTQNVLDLNSRRNLHARDQDVKASELTSADVREQVVLVVTGLYLQAIAGRARIDSAVAQVTLAQALLKNAEDRKDAGTSPAIDVLRAQVQLQTLQQREIYYEGEWQKQLLTLSRAIGLPQAQKIAAGRSGLLRTSPSQHTRRDAENGLRQSPRLSGGAGEFACGGAVEICRARGEVSDGRYQRELWRDRAFAEQQPRNLRRCR